MKLSIYANSLIFLLALVSCTSVDKSVRDKDPFSVDKTYAIFPFKSSSNETGIILAKELTVKLTDFGFKILAREEVKKTILEAGLTEEEIIINPTIAFNKLKGIDAIVVGSITMEKGLSNGEIMGSSSTGGFSHYINSCETIVLDITNGEILGSARYKTPALSNTSGSVTPAMVANNIARTLSPH